MTDEKDGTRTATRTRRRWRGASLVGILAVLGGFGYLLYGGIGENLVYYLTPSELEARGAEVQDAPVRLGGVVVPESVNWDPDALDLRFRVGDGDTEIEVHSTGAPPQMFRDGIEVLVEGRMADSGIFESNHLMVKHSNEYRAPDEGMRPQDMYGELEQRDGG